MKGFQFCNRACGFAKAILSKQGAPQSKWWRPQSPRASRAVMAVRLSPLDKPPASPGTWRALWIMRLDRLVRESREEARDLLKLLNNEKAELLRQSDLEQWPGELAYSRWAENALEEINWVLERDPKNQAAALKQDPGFALRMKEYDLVELVNDL